MGENRFEEIPFFIILEFGPIVPLEQCSICCRNAENAGSYYRSGIAAQTQFKESYKHVILTLIKRMYGHLKS